MALLTICKISGGRIKAMLNVLLHVSSFELVVQLARSQWTIWDDHERKLAGKRARKILRGGFEARAPINYIARAALSTFERNSRQF